MNSEGGGGMRLPRNKRYKLHVVRDSRILMFNMVAFSYITTECSKQCQNINKMILPICLAYSKAFNKCKHSNNDFELGISLLGIVVDWLDAEIKGVGSAVGKELAITLLKGCKVHCTRSWQRVRDRFATVKDKVREKELFASIASFSNSKISAGNNIMIAFEVLCKKKSANTLLDVIEGLSKDDATFIDSSINWSFATKWVESWMRPQHLKLLHKDYYEMDKAIWERCPSNANAVERKS